MLDRMSHSFTGVVRAPRAWLSIAILLCVASYWIGLRGPFLLDDPPNLAVIQRWLSGEISLGDMLSARTSSPVGRPVAMASLALSAWLGGYQPMAFKMGNLLVHLLCGLAAYLLVRRIALRDQRLRPFADHTAAVVAALWLLHPLQVSTVLYSVQRMAQLSTLCMLLGLWLYMVVRSRLQQGRSMPALTGLFIGVPLLTVLGALSKENALLLPALCLVLELGCFRPPAPPRAVKAFFAVGLWLPLLVGSIWFALKPARLMGAYVMRDFNWYERLVSQARALCDYLWKVLVPDPSSMGVYTDDFLPSTGLLSPPTTLLAIIALLTLSAMAWHWRKRHPALFIGWGLFLVGHAVESSLLPLELYFEHRNYFPILGVIYALVGLLIAASERLSERLRLIGSAAVVAAMALLAFTTHSRAQGWQDDLLLAETAAAARPDSMRAQLAVVDAAVRRGDSERAYRALAAMTTSHRTRVRAQGHLNRIVLSCATQHRGNPADLVAAVRNAPARVSKDEAEIFDLLFLHTRTKCEGIRNTALGEAAAHFAQRAGKQPDAFGSKAELRHVAAQFHARERDWVAALPQARLAWQRKMPPAASVPLIQAQLATGDLSGAEKTYREAATRAVAGNAQDAAGLRWLRGQIDKAARERVSP
jgi:protein O-mannosyl-transferase